MASTCPVSAREEPNGSNIPAMENDGKNHTGFSTGHLCQPSAGILVKRPENRSKAETQTLQRLNAIRWVMERCCSLFEEFAGMLRDEERGGEEQARRRLEGWLQEAKAFSLATSEAFAS